MFRRTAMTYWAWADRNQRWAMGQAGHKSAKMTLEAYQQTFPRDPEARAQVVNWLRGAGEDQA
jgi:integrase